MPQTSGQKTCFYGVFVLVCSYSMKLAIDCRMLGSGGIGSYLSALLPFFTRHYECVLIGRDEELSRLSFPGARFVSCDVSTFSLRELLHFPRFLLDEINSCAAYYTPYCNIPGGIKVPVFSTIHDVVFLDVPGLSSCAGTVARRWFYQRAVDKSATVFTVSNFSRERIQSNLRCKRTHVVVTYNALPPWFEAAGQERLQKDRTILFVGNIKRHKGLHTLLPAFSLATRPESEGGHGMDARLVIVGNAENFRTGDATILSEIDAMPAERIEFTGRISDDQLRNLYRSARILVQPSQYEGFGMPPLEALSLGTNVVLSDIPVFREIYDGFPVTFFKCGDAEDLARKIAEVWTMPPPEKLPHRYSFEETARIIFAQIDAVLGVEEKI